MTQTGPEARSSIVSLVFGHMAAQALAAAVRLGLPDALGEVHRAAPDVAGDLGTDPGATARLLRALAAQGLVEESGAGLFALTESGQHLREQHPESMAAFVRMFLDPTMVGAWQHLDASVRTGRTSFDEVFGKSFFEHLAEVPELSRTFNASMRQGTVATARTLPTAWDFSGYEVVADVGGGDGTLLTAILQAHPGVRGLLFDTAEGLAEAPGVLELAGVAERCEVATGDFFTAAPSGAEVYVIKSVLHDWDDERVVTILSNLRAVIPAHGRVLIVEPVMPATVDGSVPATMYLSDLNMLVNVGGRERTEDEFRGLVQRAGFTLAAVTPLPPPATFSVLEAVPA